MLKIFTAALFALGQGQAPPGGGLDPTSWTPEQLNKTLEYYARAVEKRARKMQVDISCQVCHRVSDIYADAVLTHLKKADEFAQADMLRVAENLCSKNGQVLTNSTWVVKQLGKTNEFVYEDASKTPGTNRDFAAAKAVLRSCFEVVKSQQKEVSEFAYQFFTNTYSTVKEAIAGAKGSDASFAAALAPELCSKMSRACNKKSRRRYEATAPVNETTLPCFPTSDDSGKLVTSNECCYGDSPYPSFVPESHCKQQYWLYNDNRNVAQECVFRADMGCILVAPGLKAPMPGRSSAAIGGASEL